MKPSINTFGRANSRRDFCMKIFAIAARNTINQVRAWREEAAFLIA